MKKGIVKKILKIIVGVLLVILAILVAFLIIVKIWNEMILMQEAYASGLSAQNAYELVRFGSDYGIMMDRKERKL